MDILMENNHMQTCVECLTACYTEPDLNIRVKCVSMLSDCADICALAVQYMSRNSEHSLMCAELCEMCATDCETFKDDHCEKCAEVCRTCAEECRKMAQ